MSINKFPQAWALILLWLVVFQTTQSFNAQDQTRTQNDEVLRINSDLVQTTVSVTNQKGQFVDDLRREQFELRIDGEPQPIVFFDRVGESGSEKLVSRDTVAESASPNKSKIEQPVFRGRTIVFFVDDLHFSLQSVDRTREMLLNFIGNEMLTGDLVAVVSASGRIGFLQQFTDNKEVLKAAVARLVPRGTQSRGYESGGTAMSEYMALMIDTNTSDKRVMDVYVEECMKQNMLPKKDKRSMDTIRYSCEIQVKNSARAILMQASAATADMYNSLASLLKSLARLRGRKLVFFLSDGFLLDAGPRGVSLIEKLHRLTDDAQKAGAVIYTIDARGLISGALDATNNTLPDPNGRMETAQLAEIPASQDAMNALAGDTGGLALRNQNVFSGWVSKIYRDSSNYYLLGWHPENKGESNKNFRRVEVSVIGRPELIVRLPRGYIEGQKESGPGQTSGGDSMAKSIPVSAKNKTPEAEMREALADPFPKTSLPVLLSLDYLDTPANGAVLTSSLQISTDGLSYNGGGDAQAAVIELVGVILNDQGKVAASFKNQLNVKSLSATRDSKVIYNHRTPLAPGLYQVRVATRDETSGMTGSAAQWIVIPNLSEHKLILSSILLGVKTLELKANKDAAPTTQTQFSVDHRFSPSANLDFWVFIYNAMNNQSQARPGLTVQAQILRGAQKVLSTTPQKLNPEKTGDPSRIPFVGSLPLKNLPAGTYELRILVTDNQANTTASQSTLFQVAPQTN